MTKECHEAKIKWIESSEGRMTLGARGMEKRHWSHNPDETHEEQLAHSENWSNHDVGKHAIDECPACADAISASAIVKALEAARDAAPISIGYDKRTMERDAEIAEAVNDSIKDIGKFSSHILNPNTCLVPLSGGGKALQPKHVIDSQGQCVYCDIASISVGYDQRTIEAAAQIAEQHNYTHASGYRCYEGDKIAKTIRALATSAHEGEK